MIQRKRKIGFYFLTSKTTTHTAIQIIEHVLAHIETLSLQDRVQDVIGEKFTYLSRIQSFQNVPRTQLIFKTATSGFRPNLIDRDTVSERENPKRLVEGEKNLSHGLIKPHQGEVFFILEKIRDGVNIRQIVNYLNHFASLIGLGHPLHYDTMVKDNFLEEIEALQRVKSAEIIVDKQLLGSPALNFSNRINSVKHEVNVKITANRMASVADAVRDVFAQLNNGRQEIKSIRLVGVNEENNDVVLRTDFIERQQSINVAVDPETGEYSSADIIAGIEGEMYSITQQ